MSKFLSGFFEHIRNEPILIVYDILLFVIVAFIILASIRVFLSLRRWYKLAVINRNKEDFRETVDYILKTNKELTSVQRFILNQTGIIPELSTILLFGLFLLGVACVFLLIYFIDGSFYSIFFDIWVLIFIIPVFALLIASFIDLRRNGRFLPFLFCLLLFTFYVWNAYYVIAGWING